MKKRLLSILLALCMVLTMLPGTAWASDIVDSGTCGDNLTWTLDADGTLAIHGTGAMEDFYLGVNTPTAQWFRNSEYGQNISSVVIDDGVTSIGSLAFMGCTNLTNVTIPESVTSIGEDAFAGTPWLSSLGEFPVVNGILLAYQGEGGDVVIPDDVTAIGAHAFFYRINLTSVIIPSNVTSIGLWAFMGCTSLTNVTIPGSVTSIGSGAFSGTPWLKSLGEFAVVNGILLAYQGDGGDVDIPGNVTTIGHGAFSYYSNLTSVTIPSSVTTIGDSAFLRCISLPSVAIPSSVTSIGNGAFASCDSLTDVYYSGNEEQWKHIFIGEYNDPLLNATIHYNSTGPGETDSETPTIITLYPANGSTFDHASTSGDARFHSTFDREVASNASNRPVLDFSVGTLQVRKASDDSVVYEVAESSFTAGTSTDVSLWGSSAPFTAISISGITPKLDYDMEYYVTMPAGFFKFTDGTVSPAIEKGEWKFRTISYALKRDDEPFYYTSTVATGEEKLEAYLYSYDESWFAKNSYEYQHDLTKMSICAAMAAYGAPNTHGQDNIENLMDDLEFQDTVFEYPDPEYDSIGYAIGHKNFALGTGKSCTLVFVAIRGGGYGIEWGGDFRVGTGKVHEGFALARDQVVNGIEEYFSEYGDRFLSECKIWIVGYSRGAATTNLVAKELDDGTLKGVNVKPENIYAFCFECPRNTRENDVADEKYQNIINIVNPIDFVPKVPMAFPSLTWGYNRYGRTLYLPYDLGGKNFYSLANHMDEEYYDITGKHMPYSPGQSLILDDFMYKLALYVGTPELYTLLDQPAFMDLAAKHLGKGDGINITWDELVTAIPSLSYMALTNLYLIGTVGSLFAKDTFKSAHYAEVCLAWLNALDGDIKEFANPVYRKVFINCPVDVSVYVDEDNMVAQIADDDVQMVEEGIFAYIDDNGQKILVFPNDEEYTIQLMATDEGTVTYTVTEFNMDSGGAEKLVSYFEMDIEEGDALTGTVENLNEVDSAVYPLTLNDEPQTPSVTQSGSSVQECKIDVTVSGNGTVAGGGYYVIGEFAKVIAEPNSGAAFLGWYINSKLVSSELEYRFLVDDDIEIVARFTTNTSQGSGGSSGGIGGGSTPNDPSYQITVPATSNGTVTVSPISARPGDNVTITVTPDNGYNVGSVTAKDSSGNSISLTDNGNETYTFTMPASNVTVSATFTAIETLWVNPFTDVSESDWFYDGVAYAAKNGLMNGVGDGKFNPGGTTTRGMIVTILYRLEGEPAVSPSAFADVAAGQYYADAVAWAAANRVVEGYGNNNFGPNDIITREQMAAILYRYAVYKSYDVSGLADLSGYADVGSVSDWALTAMRWANRNGLITGRTITTLVPKGTATRAEAATILARFCQDVAGLE